MEIAIVVIVCAALIFVTAAVWLPPVWRSGGVWRKVWEYTMLALVVGTALLYVSGLFIHTK